MYILTVYDLTEQGSDTYNDVIYPSFNDAFTDLANMLKSDLDNERINDFDLVYTGDVFICAFIDYDYNSKAVINITRVKDVNGQLINE